jgi:hypothetical protein
MTTPVMTMERAVPRPGVDVMTPQAMPHTPMMEQGPTSGLTFETPDPVAGTAGVYRSHNNSGLPAQELAIDSVKRVKAVARPAGHLATARGIAMLAEANYLDAAHRGLLFMAHQAEQQAMQQVKQTEENARMFRAADPRKAPATKSPAARRQRPLSSLVPDDDLLKFLRPRTQTPDKAKLN